MSFYALIPFAITIVVVLIVMSIVNWITNKKIDKNLLAVAALTKGEYSKEHDTATLTGVYKNKNYKVSVKYRGIGKNKILYYHISLEDVSNVRFLCVKSYAKSRLESQVNQMTKVLSEDDEFDSVNTVFTDNPTLTEHLLANTSFLSALKEIMQKYSEISIKKDITLLKRYHVTLTEVDVLLSTLDKLILLTTCLENLTLEKV